VRCTGGAGGGEAMVRTCAGGFFSAKFGGDRVALRCTDFDNYAGEQSTIFLDAPAPAAPPKNRKRKNKKKKKERGRLRTNARSIPIVSTAPPFLESRVRPIKNSNGSWEQLTEIVFFASMYAARAWDWQRPAIGI